MYEQSLFLNTLEELLKLYIVWYQNRSKQKDLSLSVQKTTSCPNCWDLLNRKETIFQFLSSTFRTRLLLTVFYITCVLVSTTVSLTRINTSNLTFYQSLNFFLTQVSSGVPTSQHEDFKHFLRIHSKLFYSNILNTSDFTYKVLHKLASDPNIAVLCGDKDSSVVIMQREDYVKKLEVMIQECITNGKYIETEDNTLKDLKTFQSFLTRNFKSTLPLDKIKPTSYQAASLYGTAKTHKFNNPSEITTGNLKLRPIVSTCGTLYYETAKYLASYLFPLTENEYSIKTTTDFAERLKNRTLNDDEALASYDVPSLFTEVPLDDTIDHIIEEIYTHNKLPKLSSKRLYERLLCNFTKNIVFSFNGHLYKQMGNSLSPVLANIFMPKLESDVVRPFNPTFYDQYVDDCFSKKKKKQP